MWAATLRFTRCSALSTVLASHPELAPDVLVGVPVEVQAEHARLELGEHGGQAGHERAQLLGGDRLVDRVVRRRAGQDLVQRRLGLAPPRPGSAENDT